MAFHGAGLGSVSGLCVLKDNTGNQIEQGTFTTTVLDAYTGEFKLSEAVGGLSSWSSGSKKETLYQGNVVADYRGFFYLVFLIVSPVIPGQKKICPASNGTVVILLACSLVLW